MEPWLPPAASRILDIGCGLAAIDILLYRRYSAAAAPDLYLADYDTTTARVHYGFGSSPAVYNSLTVAHDLLLGNGVGADSIHFIRPEDISQSKQLPRFSLVISTLAWGFHFPVDVYAQAVSNVMEDEAKLIIDIRAGTDGIEQLKRCFTLSGVIEQNDVRVRAVATWRRAS